MDLSVLKRKLKGQAIYLVDAHGDIVATSEEDVVLSDTLQFLHAWLKQIPDMMNIHRLCFEREQYKYVVDTNHPDWICVIEGGEETVFSYTNFVLDSFLDNLQI